MSPLQTLTLVSRWIPKFLFPIVLGGLCLVNCADNKVLDLAASKADGPPLSPVIFFPSVSPYTHVGAADSLVIEGNISFTTQKIIGPGGVEVLPKGLVWSFAHTMTPDTETELKFIAVDREGRQSDPKTIVIRWFPTVSLPLAQASPGGRAEDVASAFSADVSSTTAGVRAVDPLTSFGVDFGIHRVVREMRVSP